MWWQIFKLTKNVILFLNGEIDMRKRALLKLYSLYV